MELAGRRFGAVVGGLVLGLGLAIWADTIGGLIAGLGLGLVVGSAIKQ